MTAEHLEILVEEASMEAFLRALMPGLLGDAVPFNVYPHQGKQDLLDKLPNRLSGYARWLPPTWRIVVVVDQDDDACAELKKRLEQMAAATGLRTRTAAGSTVWQIVNRIAIEELEAWYFGDWQAVQKVYPRVNATVPRQAKFRDPDAVAGGTWEAFERVLQNAGYFKSGLRKIEAARDLGAVIDPSRNRSPSFRVFRAAILEAVA